MFVCPDHAARCPFEMQPGEITRPAADQRLDKSEGHDNQSSVHSIEARLDPRPHHIRKRHAQGAAQHEVGHNAQAGQKNSEPEKKNRKSEPFNAA